MNYAGKFDATISSGGQDGTSHSHVHVDSVQGHAPADAIVVPDAHFLFHADFKRSGLDLVLHNDDHELVLHDYFKGEKHAALASPDGAHLTGDIVNALTGSVDVAQAGGPAAAGHVIGHVTKLAGSATAIRNGVSIILNMGDNVEKGDVVQSGSDSTLGITFIDGTVFGLSSNARMVLNEMVYDPNGSNNSSLLSLVAGTITFVAGETAKHGDMKVDTPVATMGIRGTAVLVEIDFTVPGQGATPDAKFQVLVEPDGTTGSYILFDKTTLQPLAVVNQAGQQINISNGVISQSSAPLSPDVEKLIQDVFTLKFSANDTNPKTTTAQTDSTNPLLYGPVIKLANGTTATPVFQNVALTGSSPTGQNSDPQAPTILHIPGPPEVRVLDAFGNGATSFALTELAGRTGDKTDLDIVGGTVRFSDPNAGDQPTVSITLDHLVFYNAKQQQVAGLNAAPGQTAAQLLQDLWKAGVQITVVPASTNNNNGSDSWTFSIADQKLDFLAAGETLVLTYNVRVDNNYAPNDEYKIVPITITITGTNDAPVITSSAQSIALSGGTDTRGGTLNAATEGKLNFADVDLDDTHTASAKLTGWVMSDGSKVPDGLVETGDLFATAMSASIGTDSTGSGNGVIDWTFAALPAYAADFIPEGVTLALTYTITVKDSQGATAEQTVTVDITGAGTHNPAVVWIHTDGDGSPNNLWTTAQNWETNAVPTATDDVMIITDQLVGLTPSYPVTIDGTKPAFAHSLTMDNFTSDYSGPGPELDNFGSLTISGLLSLSADSLFMNYKTVSVGGTADFSGSSKLVNSGTFTVSGLATFHGHSELDNSGTLLLQQGGSFTDSGNITNDAKGTIEVAGGTLYVAVDVANSGQITIDKGATLALGANVDSKGNVVPVNGVAAITGGTITDGGIIEVAGDSAINGVQLSGGKLTIDSDVTLTLDGTTISATAITNNGAIDITGALTLQAAAKITNGETNAVTVESEASLTLNDTSFVSGGLVTNDGTLTLAGSSAIESGQLDNEGQFTVTGTGDALHDEQVTANNALEVMTAAALLVDQGTTITNSITVPGSGEDDGPSTIGGNITIDDAASLTINDATIAGGAVTVDLGGVLALTGSAQLEQGLLLNSGKFNISGTGNELYQESITNSFANINVTGQVAITGGSITGGKLTNQGTVIAAVGEGNDVTFDGLTVDNSKGSIQIAGLSGELILDDGTTITGGSVTIEPMRYVQAGLEVSGSEGATLSGVTLGSYLLVDTNSTLVLKQTNAQVTATNHGTIEIADNSTIHDSTLYYGQTTVDSGKTLTLDNTTVAGASMTNEGTVLVDAGKTLSLLDTGMSGGTVTNDGTLILTSGIPPFNAGSVIKNGWLDNKGQLTASGNGNVLDGEAVRNTGDGAIDISGALTLQDATHIKNGATNAVTVENRASLTLLYTSFIKGGLVTNYGTLSLEGSSALKKGQLDNAGDVNVSGSGVVFHGETVTNTGAGGIDISGTLALRGASSITNGENNAETVESDATLTLLDRSSIRGGLVTNYGTLNLEGRSALKGGQLDNTGDVNVWGSGVVFNSEIVSNTGDGAIDIAGALTLHGASSITNGEGNQETVESKGSLTLSGTSSIVGGALSNAGDVYIEASAGATFDGVKVDNSFGTIHVDAAEQSATLILDNGASITGGYLHIGGAGELVVSTVGGATFSGVTVENCGLIQVDEGSVLALDGSTIEKGRVVNDGTIDSTGTSAIDAHSLTNNSLIAVLSGTLTIDPGTLTNTATLQADGGELDITGEMVGNTGTVGAIGGGTLVLTCSTIDNSGDGTVTVGLGSTLDLDHSGISGGTLSISGTLDSLAGCNTITSSVTEDGGSIVVSGGLLDLAGSVAGGVDISGGGTVELGASGTSAYAQTTVVFETGSSGTLVLDHAGSFTGTITGLDDNTIDLADISYASNPTVGYANGVLSAFVGGVDVANLDLTGDYSGVHWVLGTDSSGGTTLTEAPGAISGLDAKGNADQGKALTVSITDGGAAVTGATYHWQVSTDGIHWTDANGSNGLSSYTPVEADEGQSLRVSLSFTDSHGTPETSLVSAGVVQEVADAKPTIAFHPTYFNFDGGTSAVGPVATTNTGNGADGVTLDGWVNWNGQGNTGDAQLLFYNGSTSDAGFGVNGIVTADGKLDLQIQHGGIGGDDTHVTIDANQWHNIALTHASGLFTLYVDGVAEYSHSEGVNGIPGNFPDFTLIGGAAQNDGTFGGEGFTGGIADVSVWNTALTEAQIQAVETTRLSGGESGLAAYYTLSDGIGTTVSDLVGSSGNLTVQGSQGWIVNGPQSWPAASIETKENAPVTIEGLSFADADGDSMQVTLAVAHGTLALGNTSGVTGTFDGATLTLDGTIAAIDKALASGLTYTPTSDYAGTDALQAQISAQQEGGAQTASLSIGIGIVPISEATDGDLDHNHKAPVIETDKFTVTQNEDGSTTITGLKVNDSDPHASTETFSLSAGTGSASSSVSPSSDAGSLTDINKDLSSITYNPAANGPAPQTDEVNISVSNNFGASETVHFIFNEGSGSNVTLQGTSGHNVILATGQSDTLIGGGQDQFVFKPTSGPDAVQHTVIDFHTHLDTIDLRQFTNINSAFDALATASQQGNDTLLTVDSHDTILLKNVIAANLHASDFIVTPHLG